MNTPNNVAELLGRVVARDRDQWFFSKGSSLSESHSHIRGFSNRADLDSRICVYGCGEERTGPKFIKDRAAIEVSLSSAL
jgi:hypothetical protein